MPSEVTYKARTTELKSMLYVTSLHIPSTWTQRTTESVVTQQQSLCHHTCHMLKSLAYKQMLIRCSCDCTYQYIAHVMRLMYQMLMSLPSSNAHGIRLIHQICHHPYQMLMSSAYKQMLMSRDSSDDNVITPDAQTYMLAWCQPLRGDVKKRRVLEWTDGNIWYVNSTYTSLELRCKAPNDWL